MSDEKEDKLSITPAALKALLGSPKGLPSRLGLGRIMGATVGALIAAALYFIPGMPALAAVLVFAALTLTGREIGARLALRGLSSDPYSISDWDHIEVLTSRLIEIGVKPELAAREAGRIVAEVQDCDDLRSVRYLRRQLPAHVFVQPPREDSTALIQSSD